ncbi:MAG: hypothetical protein AABY36_03595 [Campylobacterota bacterium]
MVIEKNYVKSDGNDSRIIRYNRDDYKQPKSIDDELNTTLKIDKNFDHRVTLRESFNKNGKFAILTDDQVSIETTREAVKKGILPKEALEIQLLAKEEKNNAAKKQQALVKLMANGGDISKLSGEERSLLAGELSKYKKEDGSHTVNMDILKKLDKQLKEENDINIKLDKALTKVLDENITQKAEINMKEKDEQSKKTSAISTLIQNDGDINKLTQEDKALIKDEIEHSKNSDGNIDIDKLKHIQEHQKAKENYTAVDIQTPKLYVQKG